MKALLRLYGYYRSLGYSYSAAVRAARRHCNRHVSIR